MANQCLTYCSILFFTAIAICFILLFTNIKNFKNDLKRPFWNTNLGGGYYGTDGWPWWNYFPESAYGICQKNCNCSKPFKCEDEKCPIFSSC